VDFINRKKELSLLKEYDVLSKDRLFFLAISGLRRVGKTTLVKEYIKSKKKSIYFFVYDNKTSLELLNEFSDELRSKNIISDLEKITTWKEFLNVLFTRCVNYTIIFDEFQNFYNIDSSFFSELQRFIDDNQNQKIYLIVLGSLISLFKKIFEDKKEPLYGRLSNKILLKPFTIKESLNTLKIIKFKDFENILKLYFIFGGFPKYYNTIDQFKLNNKEFIDIINYLFIQENAPLENEVNTILKLEFGRRSALYYSILSSISKGYTKLYEIAGYTGTRESSITRILIDLEVKFELIKSIRPLGNKKDTRYFIKHPLVLFWFKFIYRKYSDYELNKENIIVKSKNELNKYFGKRFEVICKEFLLYMNKNGKLPFIFDYIENWWGYKREDNKRVAVEIDLISFNDESKKILFTEIKWSEKVDAERILFKLKEKASFVNWNLNTRNNYYCIIAKSFKKKIKEDNVLLFDLNDLKKQLIS